MRKKTTTKRSISNFIIKVFDDEPIERFDEVGRLVEAGLLKWISHSIENNKGYHCYKKVKKK
jgi:hypothetical protein